MDTVSSGQAVEAVEGVHLTRLVDSERMSVQRGAIEPGGMVPEHSHEQEQVGYIVEGVLTFILDDTTVEVSEGELFALASNEPHAAENRTDERVVAIDVFSPPRTDPDWQS